MVELARHGGSGTAATGLSRGTTSNADRAKRASGGVGDGTCRAVISGCLTPEFQKRLLNS